MKFRNIINNYVECNEFEISYKNKKIKIYYYDEIESFSEKKIKIKKDNLIYMIIGSNMIIETMFKEYLIISGNIYKIVLENDNE